MILSSSPRSSHTPRHCGQKSISTPCRSEIDSVTLPTRQSMPWLAAADELMIISSRLAEVQILRTSNMRSEEHTSALQSLMRISYAVFCSSHHINIKLSSNAPSTTQIPQNHTSTSPQ